MCGIAGIYHPQQIDPNKKIITRMADALRHRGPDAEGIHLGRRVHLASRRLSILDIDGGNQPIYSQDKNHAIVFNGEIYNFLSIRKKLEEKGYHFNTRTDTEVILNAFLEYGTGCLDHLTGMFAFAIWDRIRGRLFLARDRMGIKPLYYMVLPDQTLVFSSEIKGLFVHPKISPRLFPAAIDFLFSFGFNVAPFTFFKNVRQLLPGHHLLVDEGGAREEIYWDIDLDAPVLDGDETQIACELKEKIAASVKQRLISDVPVAAYLSGGIDSSAITGFYAQMSDMPVTSFSITFDPHQAGYDESAYSRQVSEIFGTRHVEFPCRLTGETVESLVWHMEDPMVTLLNLPLFLLAKTARENGFKVVLSGDGSDEIFGGYDYFRLLKAMRFIEKDKTQFRKNILRRICPDLSTFVHAEIRHMLMENQPILHPALPYRFQFFQMKDQLFSKNLKEMLKESGPAPPFFFDQNKAAGRPLIDQALYFETKMRLLNLTLPLADKMSMAHSVELRTPFMDHELVQFAFQIPHQLKIKGLNEKYILKKSMEGFLPSKVCQRVKQPLQTPSAWFLDAAKDRVRQLLSPDAVKQKGYFDPVFISDLSRRFAQKKENSVAGVLVVVFFIQLWDEIFMT